MTIPCSRSLLSVVHHEARAISQNNTRRYHSSCFATPSVSASIHARRQYLGCATLTRHRYQKRSFSHSAHARQTGVNQEADVPGTNNNSTGESSSSLAATRGPPYSILFAGSDEFSCKSLDTLIGAGKGLVKDLHVLVGPDKRTSRGLKEVHRPLLRTRAEELNLPVHIVPHEGMKAFEIPPPFSTNAASASTSSVLVTASFGYLIPNNILDAFSPLNTMNLHPSLLPKYRGAAPMQWSLMNGDKVTGVTVQSLSRGRFDEGRILAQEEKIIPEGADYATLGRFLAEEGAELLLRTLQDLPSRQANSVAQDFSLATKAPKIVSEHAQIDFSRHSAEEILNIHRGISHQFPVWTVLSGKRVQLLSLSLCASFPSDIYTPEPGLAVLLPGQKGQSRKIAIPCRDRESALLVTELKSENRKRLSAFEWWKGACKGQQRIAFEVNPA